MAPEALFGRCIDGHTAVRGVSLHGLGKGITLIQATE
jgi:hypothetical protein